MLVSTASFSATGSPRRLFRQCEGEERYLNVFLGKAGTGARVIVYSVPILVKIILFPPNKASQSTATAIVIEIVRMPIFSHPATPTFLRQGDTVRPRDLAPGWLRMTFCALPLETKRFRLSHFRRHLCPSTRSAKPISLIFVLWYEFTVVCRCAANRRPNSNGGIGGKPVLQ
jgi:hypothetical protein